MERGSYENINRDGFQDGGDEAAIRSMSPRDIVTIAFVHKWLILISFLILLAGIFWGLSLRKPAFISSVKYYVDRRFHEELGMTYMRGLDWEEEINSVAELARSQGVMMKAGQNYLELRGWEEPPIENVRLAAGAFAEIVEVSPVPETDIINIQVHEADADTAMIIAEIYGQSFAAEYTRIRRKDYSLEFIQSNIARLENRIEGINQQKSALQSQSGVYDARVVQSRLMESMAFFERDLTEVEHEIVVLGMQLERDRELEKDRDGDFVASQDLRNDSLIRKFESRVSDLKMKLADERSKYTDDHPVVRASLAELAEYRSRLAEVIHLNIQTRENHYSDLQENARVLRESIMEIQTRLDGTPGAAVQVNYYDDFLDMQWGLYSKLITKFNDRLMDEEFKLQENQLIKLGEPSISGMIGVTPPAVYMLVAPIFALILALSTAFMVEAASQVFQKPEDLERYTRLPVFTSFRKI
ncbi:MAG: hypothetical protein QGG80_06995 [Candidatus Krumholzibacteria bacterium]|nr:hypothetical protein [Candidatus Krumholzibacteria bacterium]MDP6797355.1 hypothetical protein [Candidatus Krumholzibacteria bacterium]MDP7020843.1 hypothetical protein [Candidatus Krumholzibacteria bacterium]